MTNRRRVLSSDIARHAICIGVQTLLVLAAYRSGGDPTHRAFALALGALLGLAVYGPLFAVLTWFSFRGLRGAALADELRRSTVRKTWWSTLLGATGPRTWAVTIFFYVAIQVSTTFSTSDVEVVSRKAATAVSVHALAAWLYSTVIVALVVSLAVG